MKSITFFGNYYAFAEMGLSVKGPNILANMPSPLPSSLDPIPVPRDERLSGPDRD